MEWLVNWFICRLNSDLYDRVRSLLVPAGSHSLKSEDLKLNSVTRKLVTKPDFVS